MKKIAYFLIALAATISFTSCDKFLDSDLLTEKTSENFPTTEAEVGQIITSIYAYMIYESPESSSPMYIAQLAGDECLGGNVPSNTNIAHSLLKYKNNTNNFLDMWSRLYTMINRANFAIETIDAFKAWKTSGLKERYKGEALFMRAFAYWQLASVFGGVPLRTTNEVVNLPRATVDEVYEQIGKDLNDAITLLPQIIYPHGSAETGHATKAAAEALQARVFLFYTGRYKKETLPNGTNKEKVIADLQDCIDKSGHALVADQRNLWAYTNEISNVPGRDTWKYPYVLNNKLRWEGNSSIETVFAEKHEMSQGYDNTWLSNTMAMFFSPASSTGLYEEHYPFAWGWGQGPVSPAMMDEWKEWSANQEYTVDGMSEDPRMSGSVWGYSALDNADKDKTLLDKKFNDDEPDYQVASNYYQQTGYFQKKYIAVGAYSEDQNKFLYSFSLVQYPGATTATGPALTTATDLIIIRFADVLLMQAELTKDAKYLNMVRERSHLAPVPYTEENLRNERRYELAFEFQRWFDLLRWSGPSLQLAAEALQKQCGVDIINESVLTTMPHYDFAARLQATQGYWPIPQTEIDISGGVLEQNPGWGPEAAFTDWASIK